MKRAVAAIVIIAVIGIGWFVLANNKDEQPAQSQSTNQTPNTQTPSNDENTDIANPVAVQKISIADMAFSPKEITVKKGTKVTWTNSDGVNHDVRETDGKTGPNSQALSQGQSYSFTYNETGTFKYFCSIHPEMTGTVTVTE